MALWRAAGALIWPALEFAVIAMAARGAAAFRSARAAAGEVRTNLVLFAFDVVFVAPLLALLLGGSGALIQHYGLALAPATWSAAPSWLVVLIAVFVGDFGSSWPRTIR